MSEFFSILAGVLMVLVTILYFRQLRRGTSTPNPATWLIWVVVLGMNSASYFRVVGNDPIKALLSIVATFGLSVIFVYALFAGKFGKLGWVDKLALCLSIIIGIVWKTHGDARLANAAMQLVLLISFIPTIVGLLKKELEEAPPPWDVAILSYLCLVTAIILDWENSGGWLALAYPIVNGIIGNGIVDVIIRVQRRRSHA